MKSTDETEVKKSQSDSVYQNLNLSTVQSNELYGNLGLLNHLVIFRVPVSRLTIPDLKYI